MVGVVADPEVGAQAFGKVGADSQLHLATDAVEAVRRAGGLGQPAMHAIDPSTAGGAERHVDFVVVQPGTAGLTVDQPEKGFVTEDVQVAADRGIGEQVGEARGEVPALGIQQQRLLEALDKGRVAAVPDAR